MPALALPSVAVAAPAEPDPIFAAIERWKELDAAHNAAITETDKAAAAFADRHGTMTPSAFTKELHEFWAKAGHPDAYLSVTTHKQIAAIKNHKLAECRPFFHRVLNEQDADYEATIERAYQAQADAGHAAAEAAEGIFTTVPTTLAGIRAKIDFAFCVDHLIDLLLNNGAAETQDEVPRQFIETLYEAARMTAVQS